MKHFFYLFLILIAISCRKIKPEGKIVSKDISVENFTKLDLDGKFRVFYVRGAKPIVNIETYENLANNLNIRVDDNTLKISEKRPVEKFDFYNITIYSKFGLSDIKMTDSVEFNTSSEIKTDNFKLNLKNNAKFIGTIDSRRAEVEMTDHSLANFRGKTKEAMLKLRDTVSIVAPYWFIENLNISNENGGYAEVNVKDSLKGYIKNSSKLLYYNDPIRAFKIDKTAIVNNKKLD